MDILFVIVTDYRTMTIEGYGAAFVGSALLLTSVCLTDYHNLMLLLVAWEAVSICLFPLRVVRATQATLLSYKQDTLSCIILYSKSLNKRKTCSIASSLW